MWSIGDIVSRMHSALKDELCGSMDLCRQDSIASGNNEDCQAHKRQMAEKELERHLKTFVAFKTVSYAH